MKFTDTDPPRAEDQHADELFVRLSSAPFAWPSAVVLSAELPSRAAGASANAPARDLLTRTVAAILAPPPADQHSVHKG